MKRKLFNVALFGAVLVAAPVSTFVSCADYDNDIQALDKQIASLKDLVDQKEKTIQDQIAALKAQDQALADADAKLTEALNNCKTTCSNEFNAVREEIAACHAKCAAERLILQQDIEKLDQALKAAQELATEKAAELLETVLRQDAVLQDAINAVAADVAVLQGWQEEAKGQISTLEANVKDLQERVEVLEDGLSITQGDVTVLSEAVREYAVAIGDLQTGLEGVQNELASLKTLLEGKLADLDVKYAGLVSGLQTQVTANTTALEAANTLIENYKSELQGQIAAAKSELQGTIQAENAEVARAAQEALDAVVESLSWTQVDVMTLSEAIRDIETELYALDDAVAKNTKVALDNALRILELEQQIAENVTNLEALTASLEAYKAAQAIVDYEQEAATAAAIADLASKTDIKLNGVKTTLEQAINNKFDEAVAKAEELVEAAKEIAEKRSDAIQNNLNDAWSSIESVTKALNDFKREQGVKNDEFDTKIDENYNALLDITDDLYRQDIAIGERIDELTSTIQEQLDAIQDDVDQAFRDIQAAEGHITQAINDLTKAFEDADAEINTSISNLNSKVDDLQDYVDNTLAPALSSEVKSLVLQPTSFYNGIMAIEGVSYEFNEWVKDASGNYVQKEASDVYCPEATAVYSINPSKAKMSDDKNNYSYVALDTKTRSTASGVNPVVNSVEAKDGKLTVKLALQNANANTTYRPTGDSNATILALQYKNPNAKDANQVVTSDYCVVYLQPKKGVTIVDANGNELPNGTDPSYTHKEVDFAWNTTYELAEDIKVYFGNEDTNASATLPHDFTYEYAVVDGAKENFTVSDKGVVKPQLASGKDATVAVIGKKATILVTVKLGDKVVALAYYQVTVTGEAVSEEAPEVKADDKLYYSACNADETIFNGELSLDNVWQKAADVTGLTLAEVKAEYDVTRLNGGWIEQYEKYSSTNDNVYFRKWTGYGLISTNADNTGIIWSIKENDAAVDRLRSLTKEVKKVTTYIRLRSKNAVTKDTYNEFYLPITWEPATIEQWGDSQPVTWHYTLADKQWQNGEILLYPNLTKDGVYTYDLLKDAYKGEFTFTLDNKADFVHGNIFEQNIQKLGFVFVNPDLGYNGEGDRIYPELVTPNAVYTLVSDGNDLWAYNAKATPTHIAHVTPEGLITIYNNDLTQYIVNNGQFGKDKPATLDFALRLGYKVKTCSGVYELPLTVRNGEFNVRFIKPLEVENTPFTVEDSDGLGGALEVNFLENVLAFNGYTFAEHSEYVETFGLRFEIAPVAQWSSNYASDSAELPANLRDNFGILYDAQDLPYGITYKCTGNVVDDYKVFVPVTISYNWGEVATTFTIDVKRTRNNSNRK